MLVIAPAGETYYVRLHFCMADCDPAGLKDGFSFIRALPVTYQVLGVTRTVDVPLSEAAISVQTIGRRDRPMIDWPWPAPLRERVQPGVTERPYPDTGARPRRHLPHQGPVEHMHTYEQRRIAELEAEVGRLRSELAAARPAYRDLAQSAIPLSTKLTAR